MTLNSTTALTRAGTLSRVMTSCGGMVSVTVRVSTRTSLSSPGTMKASPAPWRGRTLPSRKMTARSYSGTILRQVTSRPATRTARAITVKNHWVAPMTQFLSLSVAEA